MDNPDSKRQIIVGIVGPCGSGKSTLIHSIKTTQYQFRHIAQEHSYVPDMWRKITNPDFLIFLDASYETVTIRKKLNWSLEEYLIEQDRLDHARNHADLYLQTDNLSVEDVRLKVENFLSEKRK
jgi:cytidylate kinase